MNLFCTIFLSITTLLVAPFRTHVKPESGIATLQVLANGEQLSHPVVSLGSDAVIDISFDDLTYSPRNYYYRIVHCNSDWRPSDLMSMEYLEGMDDQIIYDYTSCANTLQDYIHYHLSLPNDDVAPTVSGNYAVLIARDNDFDSALVAVACFSLVEPVASISVGVSSNTLRGINDHFQELAVEADVSQVNSASPRTDFTMVIRQNGRYDNERYIRRPTGVFDGNRLTYHTNQELVFYAGNQYRSIDFSSRYTYGSGIDRFVKTDSIYKVMLEPADFSCARRTYADDAHGGYVVHVQGSAYDSDTEADYVIVHFEIRDVDPLLEGKFYLLSQGTYNLFNETSQFEYDFNTRTLWLDLLLKQGGLNYQFIRVPRHGAPSLMFTEGNFWQTSNSYELFLYYRPVGARYDRLISYTVKESL